jgi:putative aldouronate transport system permease protein
VQNSVDNQLTNYTTSASSEAELAKFRELVKYGLIVVSSLPVLCIYPFVQKYFVKGVMIGSVKG